MKSRTVKPVQKKGKNASAGKKGANAKSKGKSPSKIKSSSKVKSSPKIKSSSKVKSSSKIKSSSGVNGSSKAKESEKKKQSLGRKMIGGIKNWRQVHPSDFFDYELLLVTVFLICFGLIMMYSSSSYSAQGKYGTDLHYFKRQAVFAVVGLVVMFVVSVVDYHLYAKVALPTYLFSTVLMLLVKYSPLGHEAGGAKRWLILIPGTTVTMQPAEVVKVAVIIITAYILCKRGDKACSVWADIRVSFLGLIAAIGVLFLTDNLSSSIIVAGIVVFMIFMASKYTKQYAVVAGGCGGFLVAALYFLYPYLEKSDNFRIQRIVAWLNPEQHVNAKTFQLIQGLYAIGSGGFFGKGLGNSMQKLKNIPEAQNDWVLTVICEELGIFGLIVVLCLFGFLLYRLMFIANNASDYFGFLLTIGVFAHLAIQVICNVCVVTGLFPPTGVTLPFISYGGTALTILLGEMGIVLNVSRQIRVKELEENKIEEKPEKGLPNTAEL